MIAFDFTDKAVLVVGGSSGIGNAIAQTFRKAGARVHVWGTREHSSDYTNEEGSDLNGLGYDCVDVTQPEAIAAAPDPFPELDVLVLSQGAVLYGRQEFEPEGWSKVMAVNVDSVLHTAQRFKPKLEAAKGSVVVVASVAAYRATMGTPAYAASKAGVVGLVRTLGQAWAGKGVRVNAFAPGLVDTKLTKVTTDHPERLSRALEKIPMGRLGATEEMAGVAAFLASPHASYVTGQTLIVDGGLTL